MTYIPIVIGRRVKNPFSSEGMNNKKSMKKFYWTAGVYGSVKSADVFRTKREAQAFMRRAKEREREGLGGKSTEKWVITKKEDFTTDNKYYKI